MADRPNLALVFGHEPPPCHQVRAYISVSERWKIYYAKPGQDDELCDAESGQRNGALQTACAFRRQGFSVRRIVAPDQSVIESQEIAVWCRENDVPKKLDHPS
jgi:hypothetical protein